MGCLHIFPVDVMFVTVTETESVGVNSLSDLNTLYMISSHRLEANFKAIFPGHLSLVL